MGQSLSLLRALSKGHGVTLMPALIAEGLFGMVTGGVIAYADPAGGFHPWLIAVVLVARYSLLPLGAATT